MVVDFLEAPAVTRIDAIKPAIGKVKPGGYLLIGHSETLNELNTSAVPIAPSIYRKPG